MRSGIVFLSAAGLAFLLCAGPTAVQAQKKKDDDAKLQARIKQLEAEVKQLQARLKNEAGDDVALQKKIAALQQDLRERDRRIDQLQALLKKDGKDEVSLKRFSQLQAELKERDRRIDQLLLLMKKDSGTSVLQGQLGVLQANLVERDRKIEGLMLGQAELDAVKNASAVQTLALRLKSDMDEKKGQEALDEAGKTLAKLPGLRAYWLGKPAEAASPLQAGLVLIADSPTALSKLTADPQYQQMTKALEKLFDRMSALDFKKE